VIHANGSVFACNPLAAWFVDFDALAFAHAYGQSSKYCEYLTWGFDSRVHLKKNIFLKAKPAQRSNSSHN